MKKQYELCIIGTGNMGEAILSGILKKKLYSGSKIIAVDISAKKRNLIKRKYRISCSKDLSLVSSCKRVLLATKPQDLSHLLTQIGDSIQADMLVISILAGKTIASIEKGISARPGIARVMPNTPALIQKGMSGVCFNKKATQKQKKETLKILQSIGRVITVKEDMMDAVTAVSGSGPAYVFYFIESYLEAAQKLGFTIKESSELVLTTIEGAFQLLCKTGENAESLRKKVTSKGGTTEAALNLLESKGFKKILATAVKAAKIKGIELNRS